MGQIKNDRALGLASVGKYHATASAMIDAVPACVLRKLSARELAELLDAMYALANRSKQIERAECGC